MMKLSAKLINLKQNEIKLSILKSDLFSSRTGAMHGTLCLEVHLHEHCKPKHELRNISISTCYMFSAMTLSITTLSINGLFVTLILRGAFMLSVILLNVMLRTVALNVVMLRVAMLNVLMLSVVILNVVVLSIEAPYA
jgi:hypothetical protein